MFTARSGSKKAAQYGRFPIPGEETMQLPAGRVRIYFDTTTGSPGLEGGTPDPDELSVAVIDEQSGDELPIQLAPGVNARETQSFTRTYVGRLEIPHEGSYKVKASQPGDYPEPHLSLGR